MSSVCSTVLKFEIRGSGERLMTLMRDIEAKGEQFAEQCNSSNTLFTDPDFGPTEEEPKGLKSLYRNGKIPDDVDYDVQWQRATSVIDNSQFNQPGRFVQGRVGDCWLLGALGMLSIDPRNFGSIIFSSPTAVAWRDLGLYIVRLCSDHCYYYIFIDNRIPVLSSPDYLPTPVYGSSDKVGDITVSIIEKAVAKFYGCYENLNGGYVHTGLRLLNGYCSDFVPLNNRIYLYFYKLIANSMYIPYQTLDKVCEFIAEQINNHSLVGCYASNERLIKETDFLCPYVYMILGFVDVTLNEQGESLIILYSPWYINNFKNNDTYSNLLQDNEDFKGLIRNYPTVDPANLVYVPVKTWFHHFDMLCLSLNFPDQWNARIISGEWTETNAGGRIYNERYHINQKYKLIVPTDHTTLYVQLLQHSTHAIYPVSFHIYPLSFAFETVYHVPDYIPNCDNIVYQPSYVEMDTVSSRFTINKGEYYIIPTTYEPGMLGGYSIIVYSSNGSVTMVGVNDYQSPENMAETYQIM